MQPAKRSGRMALFMPGGASEPGPVAGNLHLLDENCGLGCPRAQVVERWRQLAATTHLAAPSRLTLHIDRRCHVLILLAPVGQRAALEVRECCVTQLLA